MDAHVDGFFEDVGTEDLAAADRRVEPESVFANGTAKDSTGPLRRPEERTSSC